MRRRQRSRERTYVRCAARGIAYGNAPDRALTIAQHLRCPVPPRPPRALSNSLLLAYHPRNLQTIQGSSGVPALPAWPETGPASRSGCDGGRTRANPTITLLLLLPLLPLAILFFLLPPPHVAGGPPYPPPAGEGGLPFHLHLLLRLLPLPLLFFLPPPPGDLPEPVRRLLPLAPVPLLYVLPPPPPDLRLVLLLPLLPLPFLLLLPRYPRLLRVILRLVPGAGAAADAAAEAAEAQVAARADAAAAQSAVSRCDLRQMQVVNTPTAPAA